MAASEGSVIGIQRRLELRKEGTGRFAPVFAIMKNGDASAALAKGDVVTLDVNDSGGNAVQHTTTGADADLFGMADEVIAIGATGRIQVYGWTDQLKERPAVQRGRAVPAPPEEGEVSEEEVAKQGSKLLV